MPLDLINSSNCKKLGMRLRRFCSSEGVSVTCPEMARLFEGSNADRLSLLRNWLKSGENAQQVEMNLKLEKEREPLKACVRQEWASNSSLKTNCFNFLCFEGCSIPFVLGLCHLWGGRSWQLLPLKVLFWTVITLRSWKKLAGGSMCKRHGLAETQIEPSLLQR